MYVCATDSYLQCAMSTTSSDINRPLVDLARFFLCLLRRMSRFQSQTCLLHSVRRAAANRQWFLLDPSMPIHPCRKTTQAPLQFPRHLHPYPLTPSQPSDSGLSLFCTLRLSVCCVVGVLLFWFVYRAAASARSCTHTIPYCTIPYRIVQYWYSTVPPH